MHRYRTIAGVGVAALASALLIAPVAQATPAAAPTATKPATATSRGALTFVQTRHSLLGTHTWYAQTFHGLPVLGGYYVKHTDTSGRVTVDDGRLAIPSSLSLDPKVAPTAAASTAKSSLNAAATAASTQRRSGPAKDNPAAVTATSSQRTRRRPAWSGR
jgi:Zn-dependent metalloprotease